MKRVAAGIIVCNNKILIAQRKRGKDLEYFWEFPGRQNRTRRNL